MFIKLNIPRDSLVINDHPKVSVFPVYKYGNDSERQIIFPGGRFGLFRSVLIDYKYSNAPSPREMYYIQSISGYESFVSDTQLMGNVKAFRCKDNFVYIIGKHGLMIYIDIDQGEYYYIQDIHTLPLKHRIQFHIIHTVDSNNYYYDEDELRYYSCKDNPELYLQVAGEYHIRLAEDLWIEMKYIEVQNSDESKYNVNSEKTQAISHIPLRHNAFWVSKYETTLRIYEHVMGINPSGHKMYNRPVVNVTVNDANIFCENIHKLTGAKIRLPYRNEWLYTLHSGYGFLLESGRSIDDIKEYSWLSINNYSIKIYEKSFKKVGCKYPDQNGIFDLFGNVSEICIVSEQWIQETVQIPEKPSEEYPVVMGGSFISDAPSLEELNIGLEKEYNDSELHNVGIRLVLVSPPKDDLKKNEQ